MVQNAVGMLLLIQAILFVEIWIALTLHQIIRQMIHVVPLIQVVQLQKIQAFVQLNHQYVMVLCLVINVLPLYWMIRLVLVVGMLKLKSVDKELVVMLQ